MFKTYTGQLPDRVESVVLQRVCTGALPVCAAPPGLIQRAGRPALTAAFRPMLSTSVDVCRRVLRVRAVLPGPPGPVQRAG